MHLRRPSGRLIRSHEWIVVCCGTPHVVAWNKDSVQLSALIEIRSTTDGTPLNYIHRGKAAEQRVHGALQPIGDLLQGDRGLNWPSRGQNLVSLIAGISGRWRTQEMEGWL
jgi:hypothetical protein